MVSKKKTLNALSASPITDAPVERWPTERALLHGLRLGDRQSLAIAYDQFGPIAYGLALHLMGSESEAEDIVRESFLDLWRQANQIESAGKLRAHLLSTVHRLSVQRVRQQPNAREIRPNDGPRPVSGGGGAAAPEHRQEQARVRTALARLPAERRVVLDLVYFRGLTITQTAQSTGTPVGDVRRYLGLTLGQMQDDLRS